MRGISLQRSNCAIATYKENSEPLPRALFLAEGWALQGQTGVPHCAVRQAGLHFENAEKSMEPLGTPGAAEC
jgi:hypothetical protein